MILGARDTQIALLAVTLLSGVTSALSAPSAPENAAKKTVLELLRDRFTRLSPAEERLASAAVSEENVNCSDLSGCDKIIRGSVFSWLCMDPDAEAGVSPRGITIVGAEITEDVDLRWAKVKFPIVMSRCEFGGSINLADSQMAFLVIEGGSANFFRAQRAEFEHGLFLREGFKVKGVDLVAAKIDRDLDCSGGQFTGDEKTPALNADHVEIKGGAMLSDGFKAEGGVILTSARIGLELDCSGGCFIGSAKVEALSASSAEVNGNVLMNDGFRAEGQVNFRLAKVDGMFQSDGGRFNSQTEPALDLRRAKIGTLANSQNGSTDNWPGDQFLWVDGLVYERIADFSSPNANFQLNWIRLQKHDRFRSQPFEQLADVLRKMGLDEDARQVMIAKNEEHARYAQWHPEWLWYGPVGWLIGYGYDPWRAFWISLGLIVIGGFVFRLGYRRGLVTPTGDEKFTVESDGVRLDSENYPKFNAFVYSLETFVPLVKMGVGDHWMPNANRGKGFRFGPASSTAGGLLRVYYWCHILAGWILSALWIGGITGLVKT